MKKWIFSYLVLVLTLVLSTTSYASNPQPAQYWMKIKANNKYDRTRIADTGVSIETVKDDYVIAFGTESEMNNLKTLGLLQAASNLALEKQITPQDFPSQDQAYHNYAELTAELQKLAQEYPQIMQLSSIAKTLEGRDIWAVRITNDFAKADTKPSSFFMGCHHAREHLSI